MGCLARAVPLSVLGLLSCSAGGSTNVAAAPSGPDSSLAEAGGAGSPVVSDVAPPASSECPQSLADSSVVPRTVHFVYPGTPIVPFYQWESNNGYCGEVSMIQAGMSHGQWISQLNARRLCGASGNGVDAARGVSLGQSGPDGFCAAHESTPDYNAQLLLENGAAAEAATCLTNARLAHRTYDYTRNNIGRAGYEDYMSWVKGEVIAGHAATVGVLEQGGTDPQYDHIVSVLAIGTNHAPTDATYYADDVLYFDDHGGFTSTGASPAVPPGAGKERGCTTYVFGYAFGDLASTRESANGGSNAFAILIPGGANVASDTGGDGIDARPGVTPHNYAFSVVGPEDDAHETLPVVVRLSGSTTDGVVHPSDPVAGYNYEAPYIGNDDQGDSCTNVPPTPMEIALEVAVSGLTDGLAYNLYEYDLNGVSGVGAAAALSVPTSSFNAQASRATEVTRIRATGAVFKMTVRKSSFTTVIFRAVPASAS